MKKRILIVGAGYSGVLTAKKLAKKLKKHSDIEITIVDKNPFHTMLTELHEVAANRVEEDSIKLSLKRIFAGRKVIIKLDTIKEIDFENKNAVGLNNIYEYDYLVLAAGSRPKFFDVPGAQDYSFKLWSYEDAVILRDHIHDCFRKASLQADIEEKKRLLCFLIAGAGFTGTEMAGELAEYIPILCEKFEIDRELVSIYIADLLPRVIPALTEKQSTKVEKRLNRMGVKLLLKTNVTNVSEDHVEIKSDDDGTVKRIETKTVIWAAGTESAHITAQASKTLSSAERNRLETDKYLRSLSDESVFIVGDNIYYVPQGEGQTVPQVVENCEQSAAVAAHNIACAVLGRGEMKEYKPKFHGIMVSVGSRYGTALVGTAKRKFSLPSFLAMFTKHFINIVYFIQVLGWNKVFSYLKHEFFTIRNNRSFVGGHFSNKTPSFLLVPLRLWLGAVWLFEGIMKIAGGWLKSPMLKGFFSGAAAWYDAIVKGASDASSAATPAADGVTSATGAASGTIEAAGQVIFDFDFLKIFRMLFVSGKELAESTLGDLAFKIDVPLLNWFIDKVILPNNTMQMFMQIFIVTAEILIGLSLIGGLFTTLSTTFSLVLQIMFVCTTGLFLGTFWMIFAAIALLIGSGRIFGLDYYVMPFLKVRWKKLPFVRKLYIYND
ncbi:MAG: FAD-dependent oxidoreductase [Oscillospiraceae bacterium]|nr:FAD-dependent oxidoreductase [Oscillospiraceae bacterium]